MFAQEHKRSSECHAKSVMGLVQSTVTIQEHKLELIKKARASCSGFFVRAYSRVEKNYFLASFSSFSLRRMSTISC